MIDLRDITTTARLADYRETRDDIQGTKPARQFVDTLGDITLGDVVDAFNANTNGFKVDGRTITDSIARSCWYAALMRDTHHAFTSRSRLFADATEQDCRAMVRAGEMASKMGDFARTT